MEPSVHAGSLAARNKRSFSSGRSSAELRDLVPQGLDADEPPKKRRAHDGSEEDDVMGMSVIKALAKIYREFR